MKRIFVLWLMAMLLAACGPQRVQVVEPTADPGMSMEQYLTWADDFVPRWDDAVELASNTSRGSLSGPISELQGLKREVAALELQDELAAAHSNLISGTEAAVNGFMAFMRNDPDDEVKTYFDAYQRYLEAWGLRLSRIRSGS